MAERRRARRRTRLPPPLQQATRPQREQQTEVARWVQRIARARRLRQEWMERYMVEQLAQMFTGEVAEAYAGDTERLPVLINRVWPTVKAQIPGMLSQAPTFYARPIGKGAGDVSYQRAASAEGLLSRIAAQDDHLVQEAKLGLQQSFWAIGVLKALYDPRSRRNPNRGKPMYLADANGDLLYDDTTGEPVPLRNPATNAPMTEPERLLDDEVYRWQWVNWANMLLPDEGPAMLRWTWIGEEIEVAVEDAKDDARFPRDLRPQLQTMRKPKVIGESPDTEANPVFGDVQRDETLWYVELWDMVDKRHLIYAEGQPFSATQFLLDEDLPDGIEDHPYALLPGYTPKTDPKPSPWPVPHIWNWAALQREYNERREQMRNAAKRSARKVYFDQNTFPDSEDAVAALQSAVDMEGVRITDVNRPPIVAVDPAAPPAITQDLLALEKDWRDVTGTPGERTGSVPDNTATQAVIADRSASLRDSEMKSAVTLWMGTAGRKMLRLLKGTLTLEQWVKIRDWTDPEVQNFVRRQFGPMAVQALQEMPTMKQLIIQRYGKEKWVSVTRETLDYEADIGVVPGSTRARTVQEDRQQALLFMQALAQVGAVLPQLLTSRRFVSHFADLFELSDELLVDEIVGQIQQGIQQGMVGRGQGSVPGGAARPTQAQVAGQPAPVSRLAAMMTNGAGGI